MSAQLPELPQGYFWRITEIHLFSQPIIQIRKKNWIGSTELFSCKVSEPDEGLTWEDMTLLTAKYLKGKFLEDTKYELFLNKVQGDYPPKSSKGW